MKRIPFRLAIVLLISIVLVSCNLGVPAPQDASTLATAAALTVEAVLSPAASPTAASPTTDPAQPAAEASPQATNTPPIGGPGPNYTPPSPSNCEERAQITSWQRDSVNFDAKEAAKPIPPNKVFVITLLIQNTGTCVWTSDYQALFASGTPMHTGAGLFNLMQPGSKVNPGEILNFSLQLTAPSTPGDYESSYRFVNPTGENFLTFGIPTKVGSSTTTTGNLAAPGNLIYAYDCSSGPVIITLTWSDKAGNEAGYRIYRDGTKLTDLPANTTTYSDIVPASGTYEYVIAAFNANGESSNKLSAQTPNCP